MTTAKEALQLLKEGNERFAAGEPLRVTQSNPEQRTSLTAGQTPFAIILGCSDSRAPVELIFDQNLGDLFVIRIAGNIVAPSGVGSVEFAADQFGTRLVVVLGHSQCGAIKATLDELQRPTEKRSPNLDSIVNRIRPAVQPLLEFRRDEDPSELVSKAVRANIRASANHLRHGSAVLENLIENEGLVVVGAEYSLSTGRVEFFDGV
ncbi:carbonic anhydrase [Roseibacillus persicicus]|uniref:Carbonic anhydrase n=1 Tax=Roseibacillus persicicus TaxID=454148 RepID=A0A918WJT4_9BACT|nr:carbonic anhydrase [Roseibacillus persicicus]GHC52327.1 carbonic anhydrase [Roseibacillus persicicus]